MTGHKRRETDKIKNLTEHDLLIGLTTKVNSICSVQHEYKEDLKDFIKTIDKRCERRLALINANSDKVFGRAMTKWLFSILVFVVISMFCAIGINKISITKHEFQISQNKVQNGYVLDGDKKIKNGKIE